ncbi:MAG: hypothetical protein WDO19_22060 [Bacteroidota bacterium]
MRKILKFGYDGKVTYLYADFIYSADYIDEDNCIIYCDTPESLLDFELPINAEALFEKIHTFKTGSKFSSFVLSSPVRRIGIA